MKRWLWPTILARDLPSVIAVLILFYEISWVMGLAIIIGIVWLKWDLLNKSDKKRYSGIWLEII